MCIRDRPRMLWASSFLQSVEPWISYWLEIQGVPFHVLVLLSGSEWWIHVESPLTIHFKKASPLFSIMVLYALTDAHTIALCSSTSCFGTHLAHILRKPSLLWIISFICRTMINLKMVCHFIDSHSSVGLNHDISSGRGWVSWSFPVLDTCPTVLEIVYPFTYTSLW